MADRHNIVPFTPYMFVCVWVSESQSTVGVDNNEEATW